jgi:hypothetical protein
MDVGEVFRKHPLAITLAIVAVALIAWMASRGGSSSTSTDGATFTGAGGSTATTDPNAAATDQARIAAGTQNLGVIASLISSKETTMAEHDVAVTQANDALTASLAQTDAALRASLASTAATADVANRQTAAGVTIAGIQSQEQANAEAASAAIQKSINDAELAIAKQNADIANFEIQSQKDIARAGDNTSIVQGFIHFGEDVVNLFNPFSWFGHH